MLIYDSGETECILHVTTVKHRFYAMRRYEHQKERDTLTLTWKERTFNLTVTKMEYWHRHAAHNNQPGCVFCEGDMKNVAEYLGKQGLQVVDVGHAWVTIRAEKNYRRINGGMTDETDFLFKLVSGRQERYDRSREATEALEVRDMIWFALCVALH